MRLLGQPRFAAVAVLVAVHGGLLAVYDLGRLPVVTCGLLGLAFAAFWAACRRFEGSASPAQVLIVAGLMRVLLLPLPPSLSDDILRYVWDGKVVSAGFNPYSLPPESPELEALRDPLWEQMPHKDVPTVYPPLAMLVFTVASVLPRPLVGLKILLCFAELVGCWLLIRLAKARGWPPGRSVWYCWNPLAAMEVAGMGHVDGLLVTAQVAAVYWIVRGRPGRAGVAAAAGVLAKLVPLVALPSWARASRRPWLFLAAAALVTAAASLPVVLALGGAPPGLVKYGVSWEWNGPLYEPLWRLFDGMELDDTVKSGLDGLKDWTGRHDFWNRFYPYVYPQFLAKLVLLGLFAVLFLVVWRTRDPIAVSGRLFGAVAICSATFYPWYLLWVLPWAALGRHRAWLALSALLQLAYLPELFDWPLFPWVWLVIWGPFFVLLAFSSWSVSSPRLDAPTDGQ